MIRRPPRSTLSSSSAASDVYKRQVLKYDGAVQQGHSHLHNPLAPEAGDVGQARHDEAEHRSAANRALVYSAIGLGIAGGIEMVFAAFTHSVGLLGDALHNLSDDSTSLLVFLGFWVSKRPATSSHSY